MFEIDENNLPFVKTRQAFLALDLQNDFLLPDGPLHVSNPPNFLENIINVATHFRGTGNLIWIRTIFKKSRDVNARHGDSEKVITDKELMTTRRGDGTLGSLRLKPYYKVLDQHDGVDEDRDENPALEVDEEEMDAVSETYLTVEPGRIPSFALPNAPGGNLAMAVCQYIDVGIDLIFEKSHYSAFRDGRLVQLLRANFVTEIYICGALTNISVFATAMDAARHGYAITILDDCLGYRSKERHDAALRQLSEFTGCDIISSLDLIADLERKANAKQAPSTRNKRPDHKDSSLENLLSNLKLEPVFAFHTSQGPTESGKSIAVEAEAATSEPQFSNGILEESLSSLKPIEAEMKKRERVKTRIKTRKRPDPSTKKDPTSETLLAASQALEKLPATTEAEVDTSQSPEIIDLEKLLSTDESMNSENQNETIKESGVVAASESTKEIVPSAQIRVQPIPICEGDTSIIEDLLNKEIEDGIFDRVRDGVRWQKMSHQGGDVPRLVAVQGDVAEDGSQPIYRHPADESPPMLPFTPVVLSIKAEVERRLGHAVNHVLIQYYRDGTDYISEHSDKTLDIVPNTFIANVSLGAQRTMVFRTKKALKAEKELQSDDTPEDPAPPRNVCRAPLPHNSMCKMGLATNMRWLHGIRQDKRMLSEKSEAELSHNGGRISLTFRLIGTFLDKDQQQIWGQGASSKTKEGAKTVINGNSHEAEKMIRAFGKENHSSEFDWAAQYGEGFDVLHISNSPKVFFSGDAIADLRVRILLEEYGIAWTEGTLSSSFNWKNGSASTGAPSIPESLPVKFVDNDLSKSTVTGDLAIMLYLEAVYGHQSKAAVKSQVDLARQYSRMYQAQELLRKWKAVPFSVKPFQRELQLWEAFAQEAAFMAGSTVSLIDYTIYPIFADIVSEWGPIHCPNENLKAYFERMNGLESVKRALAYKSGNEW